MLKLQPADAAGLAALLSPADYAKETA